MAFGSGISGNAHSPDFVFFACRLRDEIGRVDRAAVERDRRERISDGNEGRSEVDARTLVVALLHRGEAKNQNGPAIVDAGGGVAHRPEIADETDEHRQAGLAAISLHALCVGE